MWMLRNLNNLFLTGIGFEGTIPTEVGLLTNLVNLNLRENSPLGGTIPSELGDLSRLEFLNLSTNKLSGSMPSELGRLTNLRFFFFEGNDLSGVIPNEICGLLDGDLEQFGVTTSQVCAPGGNLYGELMCPSQSCCPPCFGV
mmetsp:Transcript_2917/g.6491  ORF Transcript_2917/g.6491 Transcript_2917/m.6491 type:complete len:142 (+) Transcript_2917:122-547(+)